MANETKAWMVRHGRSGEHEELALATSRAVLGWQKVSSLSGLRSKTLIRDRVAESEPDLNAHQIGQSTGQLFAFAVEMEKDDIIVMPMKSATDHIRVGRIKGSYEYVSLDDEGDGPRHTRQVEWNADPLYRGDLPTDLQLSLKTMRTVCKLSKFDGFKRWNELALGQADARKRASTASVEDDDELSDLDIVQIAKQQIADHILEKFAGAKMERLVAEVLKASGYHVYKTKTSGDWGVDILAGSGPLGFDSPRMVVQVKAQQAQTDAKPLRELEGAREKFGADQALFLCWGGYSDPAKEEAKLSFFRTRLWDAYDFIDEFCDNYERLPAEIRDAIPLQPMWALLPSSEAL